MRFLFTFIMTLFVAAPAFAGSDESTHTGHCTTCDDCDFEIALKTNLIHDAALIPDLGLELAIGRRWSIAAEGQYAWWSDDARHRYWQTRGARVEMRYWFAPQARRRALTGHHIGIYGGYHEFDFELGDTGYQAPRGIRHAGISYGYSMRIGRHLNLDLGLSIGYARGTVTRYRPLCGEYYRDWTRNKRYFGPTGLHVTLVWFPGNPAY